MLEAPRYWQSADEDAAMQEEHDFIWRAMLVTAEVELAGRRVLDAGCNQGGFLRLLATRRELRSHEVLYLVHDLSARAAAVHRSLAPGAAYYAVMGVHAGSPGMADWHAANAERLNLPPLQSLDEAVRRFTAVGFHAAASRLKVGFVPLSDHARSFPAGLEYFYEHKVMLRFRK
jgi:SAM-dependent methyltransferase